MIAPAVSETKFQYIILLAPERQLWTQRPVLEVPALHPAHPQVRKHITDPHVTIIGRKWSVHSTACSLTEVHAHGPVHGTALCQAVVSWLIERVYVLF